MNSRLMKAFESEIIDCGSKDNVLQNDCNQTIDT
jgi:hypothetical protein